MNAEFNRIPKWRKLHQRDLRTRDHAHIEEVLPQRSLTTDGAHHRTLADVQFIQMHLTFLTSM